MSPLIRVIIPAFNRSGCVGEALASVLDQTFADFEIVVADDGSTDDTARVVEDFRARDARIRLIPLRHQGAAAARNAAIEAPGDYELVAFLNSDDLWAPAHLARAIEALAAGPETSVYFSAVEFEDIASVWSAERLEAAIRGQSAPVAAANRSLGGGFHLLDAETCRRAFVMSEFVPMTPSVVLRRDAVRRTPWFSPVLTIMEDCDLFLFVAAAGQSFVFDERIGVRVRRFGDNLTGAGVSRDALERWLKSVLIYHNGKAPLCRSDSERAYVSTEIAISERELDRFYAAR